MKRLLTRLSFVLLLASTLTALGQQIITTFVGGGPGDNTPATSAALGCPCFVAASASGNAYISGHNRVFKVDTAGNISTAAGYDGAGFSGDGGPATKAAFTGPTGVAVDSSGNLYIADTRNNRVRKVDTSGTITTIAGNGIGGYGGDGGPATAAELSYPSAVAVDSAGNVYIADRDNSRVRKVDTTGTISTFAGNGTQGFAGDGGLAINAELFDPNAVAVHGKNIYIADTFNDRIRKIDASGRISTVAGNGTVGFSGDGAPATSAELYYPTGVAVRNGNIYIADTSNDRIRKVNSSGIISTVAGTGAAGNTGDGGPAASAELDAPEAISFDNNGNLYIAQFSQYVRKINSAGIISTLAGNGEVSFSGDGAAANHSQLAGPAAVASDSNGSLYVADTFNKRIRKIDASGIISTVAGNGFASYSGDGGPATSAELNYPYAVAVDANGNLYIADTFNERIRKVDSSGMISTVAGRGGAGYSGDGGPATSAKLRNPTGIAVDSQGNLYIADTNNNRIRKVDTSGIITTIARFEGVSAVAVDSSGNVYFSDPTHYRLRKVDSSGVISVVAGNGKRGFSGDGGAAASAELSSVAGIAVDTGGNIYFSDNFSVYGTAQADNDRVRKIDTTGIISTIAGNGIAGFSGDGGLATDAEMATPNGLAVDGTGNLYIADAANERVRKLTPPSQADSRK